MNWVSVLIFRFCLDRGRVTLGTQEAVFLCPFSRLDESGFSRTNEAHPLSPCTGCFLHCTANAWHAPGSRFILINNCVT